MRSLGSCGYGWSVDHRTCEPAAEGSHRSEKDNEMQRNECGAAATDVTTDGRPGLRAIGFWLKGLRYFCFVYVTSDR